MLERGQRAGGDRALRALQASCRESHAPPCQGFVDAAAHQLGQKLDIAAGQAYSACTNIGQRWWADGDDTEPDVRLRPRGGGAEGRAKALLFLGAAISFVASVSLWFSGHELQGIYVGLWVPSILSLGATVLPRGERS